MPLQTTLVGVELGTLRYRVTARHLLAYAAVAGALDPVYADDTRPGGLVGFPLFGVRLDWPLRPYYAAEAGLTADEIRTAVHATRQAPRSGVGDVRRRVVPAPADLPIEELLRVDPCVHPRPRCCRRHLA